MKAKKLLYLESLRGFAALIVVLYHGNLMFSESFLNISIINHGYVMVDFFFVLSGFVIAYNYADRITKWRDVVIFQTRRFLRLYPLHFVTFLLFVGIEGAKYLFEIRSGIAANNPAFSTNDWGAVLSNLSLTHSFAENDMTFNDPSWSISAEFYTYLLFAVLFLLIQKPILRLISGVMIVVLSCAFLIQYNGFTATTGLAIIRCFYGFFVGVITCMAIQKLPEKYNGIIGVFGFILLCFILFLVDTIPHGVFSPLFAIVIGFFYISRSNIIKRVMNSRPFVYLGTISYGLYMWHVAVWWMINNGLKYVLKTPTIYSDNRNQDFLILSDSQSMGIVMTGVIVTFILASLSYHLLEKPLAARSFKN